MVDRDGLVASELPRLTASLLYLTPSHQYPTGVTLSQQRRIDIIAWARRYGCYIIEDDYDCDIRYEGSHLQPIAALAPDCTIYLGTFSKSLGGGLRLGFMVVPEQIAEAVRAEKCQLNNGNPWLEQATLADFMRSGSYAAHILRARSHYKESRDCLIAALRGNFGDVLLDGDKGGLHVLWHLPPGVPDAVTDRRTGAARPRRRLLLRIHPCAFPAANASDQPCHHARLCRAVAQADRKGHRAAVGCHR